MEEHELRSILKRFADSGWELISLPANAYLCGESCKDELISAVEQANEECGSCGCEYDALYRRFLALKHAL
jgi:glutathione peroxidase-family protein